MEEPRINIMTFLLDDEAIFIRLISDELGRHSIEHRAFQSPGEFIKALNADVHVCILDYYLGSENVTALQVMEAIFEVNPHCFVIIMSSQDSKEVMRDLFHAGCNRYVIKGTPYMLEELARYVNEGIQEVLSSLAFYQTFIARIEASKKRIQDARSTQNDKPVL